VKKGLKGADVCYFRTKEREKEGMNMGGKKKETGRRRMGVCGWQGEKKRPTSFLRRKKMSVFIGRSAHDPEKGGQVTGEKGSCYPPKGKNSLGHQLTSRSALLRRTVFTPRRRFAEFKSRGKERFTAVFPGKGRRGVNMFSSRKK